MNISRRLRFLRKEHNLDQGQLADKLGITLDMIKALENGAKEPSKHILKRCAEVFGLKDDFFVKDTAVGEKLEDTFKRAKTEAEENKREEELSRRAEELSRRLAPNDVIGGTLRIKKQDAEKAAKEAARRTPPSDDFDFAGFDAAQPGEKPPAPPRPAVTAKPPAPPRPPAPAKPPVQTKPPALPKFFKPSKQAEPPEPPELLTHLPMSSAGEPPLLAEVVEEEKPKSSKGLRDSAHAEPIEKKKTAKEESSAEMGKPRTLDEMVRELVHRQNALIALLIEKRVITKEDLREKLR